MADSRRGCSQGSPGEIAQSSIIDENKSIQQDVSAQSLPHHLRGLSVQRDCERPPSSDEPLSLSAFLKSTEGSSSLVQHVSKSDHLFLGRPPFDYQSSSMHDFSFPENAPSGPRSLGNAPIPLTSSFRHDHPMMSQPPPRYRSRDILPLNRPFMSLQYHPSSLHTAHMTSNQPPMSSRPPYVSEHTPGPRVLRPPPPNRTSMSLRPLLPFDQSPLRLPQPNQSSMHLPPVAESPMRLPLSDQSSMCFPPPRLPSMHLLPPAQSSMCLPPNQFSRRLSPPDRLTISLPPPPFLDQPPCHLPIPQQPLAPFEDSPPSHVHFANKDLISTASQSCFADLDPISRFRRQVEERKCAQSWISDLVSKRTSCNRKTTETKPKKQKVPLLIPLVRKDIKSCFEYLALLEKKRNFLQQEYDMQMWNWEVADVQVAMKTITDLMAKLRKHDFRVSLKLKLLKVDKKKQQRIRRRERIKAIEDEKRERMRRANAESDKKRHIEEQAVKEKLQKKEENRILKDSQEKIKQKQEDVKRYLRILAALSKLRRARLQKRKVELGAQSNADKDHVFQRDTDNLNELLERQRKKYCAEEDAILPKSKCNDESDDHLSVLLEGIKEYLFGESLAASHPFYPLYLENTKANNDVEALIGVRSQWDKYVVPDDHPSGSHIPTDWVYPSGGH